ncbi:FadR/GntR family transcriptional regulator [[Kitasatospora] papulosa]|uniref:FadR/GntR family transcriptional regulator n=1 Tax=[Kitasatospora] papulosa TaxID=1464011 RepID=UPI00381EC58D
MPVLQQKQTAAAMGRIGCSGEVAGVQAVGPAAVVRAHITQVISDEKLAPGAQLPTERDLAASTGASRAVVRSVLKSLADEGVVVRHVGRGTFVAPGTEAEPAAQAGAPSPVNIMQARLVLEPEFLPTVVISATEQDLREMRRCHQEGEQAASSAEFEHWDTLLHHSFAVATHNPLIVETSRLLIDSRHQPVWGRLKQRTYSPGLQQNYCQEHEAIVRAIEERDADEARLRMRAHLQHVSRELFGHSL